jgi:hypothetical protein
VARGRIAVLTSHRAVSLKTVAAHIARAAEASGREAAVVERYMAPPDVQRAASAAVIVMPADPISAAPWMMLARDLSIAGMPAVYYATVEGALDASHVARWMRAARFVANSEYTASKLREAGLPVAGVVHHGVDMAEVEGARRLARQAAARMRELGADPERDVVAVTVASGHPRKGLDRLARVARVVSQREPRLKFLVITDESGAAQLEGTPNVIAYPALGALGREEVLSYIAAGHVYVQPSLAEGFCLPVLEAHALGVPAVHADLPPLREYSAGWRVPARGVTRVKIDGGILYELHEYDAGEFAEVLLQVADLVMRGDSAVDDYRARALKVAREHDIHRVYPGLLDALETPGSQHLDFFPRPSRELHPGRPCRRCQGRRQAPPRRPGHTGQVHRRPVRAGHRGGRAVHEGGGTGRAEAEVPRQAALARGRDDNTHALRGDIGGLLAHCGAAAAGVPRCRRVAGAHPRARSR